jgi:hypothetical protein
VEVLPSILTRGTRRQYRDARQIDKYEIDLATRSASEEVQNVLVTLLHNTNSKVVEADEEAPRPATGSGQGETRHGTSFRTRARDNQPGYHCQHTRPITAVGMVCRQLQDETNLPW